MQALNNVQQLSAEGDDTDNIQKMLDNINQISEETNSKLEEMIERNKFQSIIQ